MKKKFNFSPNYSGKIRTSSNIKFVIIHYTGMQSEIASIERLKNPKFPISKKFSAFSLKEIDRSLLLEDFLRKSENVYSGDF